MTTEELKDIVETVESVLKSIGLVIGACWVYFRFIRTRENHPKIQFDIDLRLLGRQDEKIIIEVVAILENKGVVRHRVNNFTCDILVLRENKPVIPGDERINYQVLFEKANPAKTGSRDTTRIVWIPEKWYESFVDAGVKQRYTYLAAVSGDAAFIGVYSQFYYKGEDSDRSKDLFCEGAGV